MQNSTRWRDKRRYEKYRRIAEKLDDGMYALALLKSVEDDEIDFELDDRKEDIKSRLENCIIFLDDLYETSMSPSTGTIEQRTLIDELNLKPEEISRLVTVLEATHRHFISTSNFEETYDRLREIEQYANRKSKEYQKRYS